MKNFVAALRWRGMIHDFVPGTEAHLNNGPTKGYIGFDPSAASLHLGNLVTIMLLRHFQEAGHKPIAVVGGATGMIGDPSGRTQERTFLTEEALRYNQACIGKQLERFLDFTTGTNETNRAELLNNFDWFKEISFLHFLKDIGKHMPIGYMMAKDSVKQRLETGISYTEFAYQLLQGYDFYHLYVHQGVTFQMGGSDQWGNLTTGVELIRKKKQAHAFALTVPLLTRSDGTKFGKTASGTTIWLDPAKTSPYALYQFLLNCSDEEVEKLIKIFSFCTRAEIETLILAHRVKPETRILQQTLAKLVTTLVHSEEACNKAMQCTAILFHPATTVEELFAISEADLLTVCATIPQVTLTKALFDTLDSMVSLLSVATEGVILPSKSEAKRMILSRGILVNKTVLADPFQKPIGPLLHNRYLLVQKGKKTYYLIVVQ